MDDSSVVGVSLRCGVLTTQGGIAGIGFLLFRTVWKCARGSMHTRDLSPGVSQPGPRRLTLLLLRRSFARSPGVLLRGALKRKICTSFQLLRSLPNCGIHATAQTRLRPPPVAATHAGRLCSDKCFDAALPVTPWKLTSSIHTRLAQGDCVEHLRKDVRLLGRRGIRNP